MEQSISNKPHPVPSLDFRISRPWFASVLIELLRAIALIIIFIWLLSPALANSTRTINGCKQGEAGSFPKK